MELNFCKQKGGLEHVVIVKIKRRSFGKFGRENPNPGNRVEHEKLEERAREMRTAPICCVVFFIGKNLESRGSCCYFNQLTFSTKEG